MPNNRKRSGRLLGLDPDEDISAALDEEKEKEEEERQRLIERHREKKKQKKNSPSANDEILVETDFLKRMRPEDWNSLSRDEKVTLSKKYAHITNATSKATSGEVTNILFMPKAEDSFLKKLLAQPDQTIQDEISSKCKYNDFNHVDFVTTSTHYSINSKNGWDDELNKVPLKKNHVYKLMVGNEQKNPYIYQTDNDGRVQFVTGKLEFTKDASSERGSMQKEAVSAKGGMKGKDGTYLNHDDAGHVIGARFKGPDALINYFPQHTIPNEIGQWKNIENIMAEELKSGNDVKFSVLMEFPKHESHQLPSQRPQSSLITVVIRDRDPPHSEKSYALKIENPEPVDKTTLSDNDLILNNPSSKKRKRG